MLPFVLGAVHVMFLLDLFFFNFTFVAVFNTKNILHWLKPIGDPGWIPGSGKSAGEGIGYPLQYSWASLVAQMVKNLPAIWEAWVQSPG